MSKEVIAFDLDDVVVHIASPLTEHYNQVHGTCLTLEDYYTKDFAVYGTPDMETAIKRFYSYLESEEFFEIEPDREAVVALNGLKNIFDLFIVTGRHTRMRDRTQAWIDQHLPNIFRDAVFSEYYTLGGMAQRTKADICLDLEAKALVDDHLEHALRVAAADIDVYLFGNYPWNQCNDLPKNIKRVMDWTELKAELLNETG